MSTMPSVGELRGRVLHGEKRGRLLGYPTANLSRQYFRYHPVPDGVYAAWLLRGRNRYPAAAIVGVEGKLEVHLLEWHGTLYGRYLRVLLVQRTRGLTAYRSDAAMRQRIAADIRRIRRVLNLPASSETATVETL